MDVDEFWSFLERSARESGSPRERTGWLEDKLSRVSRTHIVDFQAHLDAPRRPIDTYATWGAAYQIMDGLCPARLRPPHRPRGRHHPSAHRTRPPQPA